MSLQLYELNPALKAYALGYATSTIPRVPDTISKIARLPLTFDQKLALLRKLLVTPIGIRKFPTACALIVGGSTVLPRRVERLLNLLMNRMTYRNHDKFRILLRRTLLPLSSFSCAWIAFKVLNEDENWARRRAASSAARLQPANKHYLPPEGHRITYAGKTIDLTLFALCRAIDAIVVTAWSRTRRSVLHPDTLVPQASLILRNTADSAIFAASSAVIMWAWFFAPERLPATYNRWISRIAQIDNRLVNALRLCRQGDFVYGSSDTQDADLPSLCKELNMPERWGNPAVTVPVPCELYHCGAGKSCEIHACKRFSKTFMSAMRLYLPLQLVGLLRRSGPKLARLPLLLKNAARSSAFLAAFVSLFYYFVCLARTRIGPKIFPSFSPQRWDSGLCVLAGCLACGWSIMLEKKGRRQEIAFFVAPRALGTLLPRVYDKRYQHREQMLFACSTAVIMSVAQRDRSHIRGVFGDLLGGLVS